MAIEDEIYKGLTGHSRPQDETFTDVLGNLEERFGSTRAAAKAAGIPPSTWRGWKAGRQPSNPSRVEQVIRTEREARMTRDFDPATFAIKAIDRKDGRNRTISARQLKLTPGTLDKVREAYLRGDDQGAAQALLSGIGDRWYREWLTPGSTAARTGTLDGSGGGPEGAAARLHAEGGGGGTGGAAGGGGAGAGGGGGWEGDEYDWVDVSYEGGDIDSDYGATVGGVA